MLPCSICYARFWLPTLWARFADVLGPSAADLVTLLPELADTLPDAVPSPTLAPEQEKRRCFQALTQFFIRVAADQPLLVIIEDLHWSDDTSLEWLLILARRVASVSIFLVLTYRGDELHPGWRTCSRAWIASE